MNNTSMHKGILSKDGRAALIYWLPIIAGIATLYVPSLFDLFQGPWSEDEQMHGPVVLGIACWLFYRNWPAMMLSLIHI